MREISLTARPNVFQIATVGGWHAVSLEWYVVRVDNGFHYSDVNAMVGRDFEVPKNYRSPRDVCIEDRDIQVNAGSHFVDVKRGAGGVHNSEFVVREARRLDALTMELWAGAGVGLGINNNGVQSSRRRPAYGMLW